MTGVKNILGNSILYYNFQYPFIRRKSDWTVVRDAYSKQTGESEYKSLRYIRVPFQCVKISVLWYICIFVKWKACGTILKPLVSGN